MDELEQILNDEVMLEGYGDLKEYREEMKALAKKIRSAGYHKDPQHFCYAPMHLPVVPQNTSSPMPNITTSPMPNITTCPTPKRKRIELTCNAGNYCSYRTLSDGTGGYGCKYEGYCDYQLPRDSRLNEGVE
jgi:hypothetical protein